MDAQEKTILFKIKDLETELNKLHIKLLEIRSNKLVKIYCYTCDKDIPCLHFQEKKRHSEPVLDTQNFVKKQADTTY